MAVLGCLLLEFQGFLTIAASCIFHNFELFVLKYKRKLSGSDVREDSLSLL